MIDPLKPIPIFFPLSKRFPQEEGGGGAGRLWGEVTQTMCTHMNKCEAIKKIK
jgi:hypothetical protein